MHDGNKIIDAHLIGLSVFAKSKLFSSIILENCPRIRVIRYNSGV